MKIKVIQKKKEENIYIQGPDKFPLDDGRWGYLPTSIQLFLNETCKDAINLSEFVESLKITLEDLDFSKKNGFKWEDYGTKCEYVNTNNIINT